MKFFETSKFHTLKKSTYISLRWIGIIGQLVSVYIVYFFLNFDFNFILSNLIIFIGILSNFYLIFIYDKTQLSDRSALIFLIIDIFQLGSLVYLTGGIVNPFVIFIIIIAKLLKPINPIRITKEKITITTIIIALIIIGIRSRIYGPRLRS